MLNQFLFTSQLKERVTAPCFHLIGYILTKVTWNELVQYLMIYQPPDMTARFQSALLILLVQCYGDKSLLEVGGDSLWRGWESYLPLCLNKMH